MLKALTIHAISVVQKRLDDDVNVGDDRLFQLVIRYTNEV